MLLSFLLLLVRLGGAGVAILVVQDKHGGDSALIGSVAPGEFFLKRNFADHGVLKMN